MVGSGEGGGFIERLYPLSGGLAIAPDRAVYTPGRWEGERAVLSCNAYLMRRAGAWVLWDTGIDDAVAGEPGGRVMPNGIRGFVARPLARQLGDVGIDAADVSTVILSHAHFDHAGNAGLFPKATWHVQRREHEAMFGPDPRRYGYVPECYEALRRSRQVLMDGDQDVFGDGSARVISSPGHTPGHCSLLIRLRNAGPVLLSADFAHDRYNFENRCVPRMNSDAEATRASMDRVDAVVREAGAQLWLNHDIVQNATIPHAPAFVD